MVEGGGWGGAGGGSSLSIQFKKERSLQVLDITIRIWIIFFIAGCVPNYRKIKEWIGYRIGYSKQKFCTLT